MTELLTTDEIKRRFDALLGITWRRQCPCVLTPIPTTEIPPMPHLTIDVDAFRQRLNDAQMTAGWREVLAAILKDETVVRPAEPGVIMPSRAAIAATLREAEQECIGHGLACGQRRDRVALRVQELIGREAARVSRGGIPEGDVEPEVEEEDRPLDGRDVYGAWCLALRERWRAPAAVLTFAAAANADRQPPEPKDFAFLTPTEQHAWELLADSIDHDDSVEDAIARDRDTQQQVHDAVDRVIATRVDVGLSA